MGVYRKRVAKLFFKTPRKCEVYGISCEGSGKHVFYLADEGQSHGKGANAVVSQVHHYLNTNSLGEQHAHFQYKKDYLSTLLNPIKNVTKFHQFHVSADHPDVNHSQFPLPIRSTRSSPTKRSGTGLGGRVHLGSPEIGKMSCGGRVLSTRVELGRVWSENFGDRDDRVNRIGSGNPP
ncbi:hypothetical protein DPMN_031786 [Dreissena polymorpha]|uniref:Uncharacterized protein n=1 Tax=Dreissena polymorpha TaxID=45954 RepID=A0A9D4RJN0_DREPO|nr:hypothetical protein DPMN_031786 [Dreissena polymorpha]